MTDPIDPARTMPWPRSPADSRPNRRRMLLELAFVAETVATLAVVGCSPSEARTTTKPDQTPEPPPAPTALDLGGGRSVRLLGLGGATTDGLLHRIGSEIGAAVRDVEAFWGSDWQREIIVVAAGTDEQFAGLVRGPAGTQWVDVAAAAVADRVDPLARTASGQRVIFAPGATGMSDYALRIVLRHELFHFASRASTALDAPRWLTEGVADFVGRPAAPRPGPSDAATLATLPTDADFAGQGAALTLAYDRAWWFARFVAETRGTECLKTLYLRAGGARHLDAAAALVEVTGSGERALLGEMRGWLSG